MWVITCHNAEVKGQLVETALSFHTIRAHSSAQAWQQGPLPIVCVCESLPQVCILGGQKSDSGALELELQW